MPCVDLLGYGPLTICIPYILVILFHSCDKICPQVFNWQIQDNVIINVEILWYLMCICFLNMFWLSCYIYHYSCTTYNSSNYRLLIHNKSNKLNAIYYAYPHKERVSKILNSYMKLPWDNLKYSVNSERKLVYQ